MISHMGEADFDQSIPYEMSKLVESGALPYRLYLHPSCDL